jgi:type IV secretion system protein VirD4
VPVLVLLDEFARLGHATVIAKGFAYVAGYGLRLLPVLQSPAQLRHEYGPDLAHEIIANCGVEVVFAPKDIAVARQLSDRLGYYGLPSFSRSRPSGLGTGVRTITQSEQRRALMLPQELIELGDDEALILRAGVPPIRARKLRYYEEAVFKARLAPPPRLRTSAAAQPPGPADPPLRRILYDIAMSGVAPFSRQGGVIDG